MTNTLKPCPFCGGTRIHFVWFRLIQCFDCLASGPLKEEWSIEHIPDRQELRRAWNQRAKKEGGE